VFICQHAPRVEKFVIAGKEKVDMVLFIGGCVRGKSSWGSTVLTDQYRSSLVYMHGAQQLVLVLVYRKPYS
jgi:hypothetical protein